MEESSVQSSIKDRRGGRIEPDSVLDAEQSPSDKPIYVHIDTRLEHEWYPEISQE